MCMGTQLTAVSSQTVLVTGASEGLGRSAARLLAAKGASVILVARTASRLESAIDECKAAAKSPSTQRFHYITADLSEHNVGEKLIADATTWNNGSAPDIVWCAAGMSTPLLFLEESTAMVALRRNMDVNFYGATEVAHAILKAWVTPTKQSESPTTVQRAEPKHLIFTCSVLALYGLVGYATYAPSKWALRGLADTLAHELRLYPDTPVKLHVVYPGGIQSPGFENEMKTKPDITKKLEEDDVIQSPDDVASLALNGLEKGYYGVTVGFLGSLMLWGFMGGGQKNNWLLDTLAGMVVPFVYPIVEMMHRSQMASFLKKNGHPSSWPKKAS
jgi:3-dehydrosphinganine reductase